MKIPKEIRKTVIERVKDELYGWSYEDRYGVEVVSVNTVLDVLKKELNRQFKGDE